MHLDRLPEDKLKELLDAYERKNFTTVREIITSCKPCMSGCGNCQYTHDLAAYHIEIIYHIENGN